MKDNLIFGPLENKRKPEITGGIIILFLDLRKWLISKNIAFDIIDTNKTNYCNKLWALINIYIKIILKVPFYRSISLHGTANDYSYIAPFLVFYSRIWNKKVVLRKFAGNFHEIYNKLSPVKKKLVKYSLEKSSVLLFETISLQKFGKIFNEESIWLPNVRPRPSIDFKKKLKAYNKRFVYISQVSKEKGILDLVEVFKSIDSSYKLDIYGSLKDVEVQQLLHYNISYKGVIDNDLVIEKILDYDCLILPSYREGYPGIVIEALSVGIPTIVTNVGGVPEIITDGKEGFLFEPGDIQKLKILILNLNGKLKSQLSSNALEQFEKFDSETVYSQNLENLL